MEKSSIEILSAYAKKNNYKYWTNSDKKIFSLTPSEPFLSQINITIEFKSGKHTYYFCASDRFGGTAHTGSTYSGIYRDFSPTEVPSVKIRPKLWIDNLSFSKKLKTGVDEIDKTLLIKSSDVDFVKKIISRKLGTELNKISKQIEGIEFIIEPNFLTYNSHLKGKSIIALQTNKWLIESKDLNLLFEKGANLLELVRIR